MGIPTGGPTYVYGDNMSVIHNTQRPESTLKNKSNSIAYHACRESVAMGESLTSHVRTHLNPADLATKVIPGGKSVTILSVWYCIFSVIQLMIHLLQQHNFYMFDRMHPASWRLELVIRVSMVEWPNIMHVEDSRSKLKLRGYISLRGLTKYGCWRYRLYVTRTC